MNKIIYNLIFNRKNKLNHQGTALIQIEAYLHNKRKYFSTKLYITPKQWDERKRIIVNHPNAEGLNHMLYQYISNIEKKELELWQKGFKVTLESLKDSINEKKGNESFLYFIDNEIISSSLKESTKKNHKTTLLILRRFNNTISFSDISFEFLCSFDMYLREKKYHTNTIAKHMKHIKRYVNIAINKGLFDLKSYPFRKYIIKSSESNHTYLSPEELKKLETIDLGQINFRLQKNLDAFLFCCYVGLRYSDFTNLSMKNIVQINNGMWLIYKSVKTNIEVRIPIYLLFQGKALNILRKYINDLNSFFILPDNSNVNKDLIKLSKVAGITKHISFHTARHTNATLLIFNGANITTVQKLLGHKSVRTTQVYTNIMDMNIVRDIKQIANT